MLRLARIKEIWKQKTLQMSSRQPKTTSSPADALMVNGIYNASPVSLATRTPESPSHVSYAVYLSLNYKPHDMASFSCRPRYLERILMGSRANATWAVGCLLDTSVGPNLGSNSFLLRQWCPQTNLTKFSNLHTLIKQVVQLYIIIPMFVRIGDLHVQAWLGVVKNLAVDVL